MKLSTLASAIKKYYLAGLNETAIWKIDNFSKLIKIGTSTPNQVICAVIEIPFTDEIQTSEFGVSDTTKLVKMIGVLNEEIVFSVNEDASKKVTSIGISSGEIDIQYVTADLKVIRDNKMVQVFKGPYPVFEVEILVDAEFVDNYLTAKSALNDGEYVVFQNNPTTSKLEMIFGQVHNGNKALNTSKIKISPKTTAEKFTLPAPLSFNAEYLRQILAANKGSDSAILKLSSNTLGYVEYVSEGIKSVYHIKGISGK